MARWKLFRKSKSKEEEITKPEETLSEEGTEEDVETTQEPEDQPLVEYHETLRSEVTTSKKGTTKKQIKTKPDQRIWRNVDSIEEKVDNLHITRAKKPVTELDKTVDKLISKKKIK